MSIQLLLEKRIFLIEDNVSNRSIMELILEQQGAKIGFDRWGKITSEKLLEFAPIDIILLDLMFPNGITGYDIFTTIRQFPEFAHVPIVAISASEPSVAIPKTRSMGFAGFIRKPIDYDSFPHQISAILQDQAVWDAG